MNKEIYEKYLVSPITKKSLHIDKKAFITDDKAEKYDIVKIKSLSLCLYHKKYEMYTKKLLFC